MIATIKMQRLLFTSIDKVEENKLSEVDSMKDGKIPNPNTINPIAG